MRENFLRSSLAKESRAYGFTIAFWGSGALLIKAHGLPTLLEALSYGIGAVAGFSLLAIWTYSSTLGRAEYDDEPVPVLGMIHFLGAPLPIIFAHYFAKLPAFPAFLLTGIMVSTGFNIGMILEQLLSERAEKLEKRLVRN